MVLGILCLFGLIYKVISIPKMISMYARTYDSGTLCNSTWDDCVLECYNNGSCIGVHSNLKGKITTFSAYQLNFVNPNNQSTTKFSFKLNMTFDICPIKNPPLYGGQFSTSTIQTFHNDSGIPSFSFFRYTINQTTNSWHFTYKRCLAGEILFYRNSAPFCLKIHTTPTPDYSTAQSECAKSLGNVFSSYSMDEFAQFKNFVGSNQTNYWVNGMPACGERCYTKSFVDSKRIAVWGLADDPNLCKPTYCQQCLQLVNGLFIDKSCTNSPAAFICIYSNL